MNKLILIMIDGISAGKFELMRDSLPHLDKLARQGTQVKALTPETCGTSFPGRTSMIIGRPPAEHGIYGNRIWDGEVFRWSNPYDVRGETLAGFAKKAGRDVVNVGYGMVRAEDCNLFVRPWWVNDVMSRGRDNEPHPANEQWSLPGRDAELDPENRLAKLGIKLEDMVDPIADREQTLQLGMLADYQLMELAAKLVDSDQAPDLIMLEVGITDYYLHAFGTEHPMTELSIRTADAQVGCLLKMLESAGKLDEYNFAIMSDHGHAAMPDAVYCDRLLPEGVRWSSEGSMLLVAPRSQEEAEQVTKIMLDNGFENFGTEIIPEDQKELLLVFTCQAGQYVSFEPDLKNTGQLRGGSKYQSNHGMRPGTEEDFRFCIFSGPRVPQQVVEFGEAIQVAPTMAEIMGLETDWSVEPLLKSL